MKNQGRDTSIDQIKSIAILIIVLFHYADHGVIDLAKEGISGSWLLLSFFKMGGGTGNALFILCTGYLMADSNWNYKKLIKLWAQIWFYSVIFGVMYYLRIGSLPGIKPVVKIVFPVISNSFWYFSSYFILYLLVPYIDVVLSQLKQRETQVLILILLIIFSIIPTFTFSYWLTGINNIMIFIALYIAGNYIKRFKLRIDKAHASVFAVTIALLIMLSEIILKCFTNLNAYYFTWDTYKFPVILLGIMIFLWLKDKQTGNFLSNIVSRVSTHSSAVYLIHIGWISPILFTEVFNNSIVYGRAEITLHVVIYVISILAGSILVDMICKPVYSKIGEICINLSEGIIKRFRDKQIEKV